MRFGFIRRVLAGALWGATWCHSVLAQTAVEPRASWLEPSARELSLSLGARVERGETRSGVLGFASLSVPLDRFVTAAPIVSAPDAPAADARPPEANANAPAGDSAATARDSVAPLMSAAELSRVAREAVAAALRANGAALRREELDRLASRARHAAALPELRMRGQRSDDESLRLTPSTEDPYRYSVSGGRDWLLEAQLTFRLSRLVFADEELAIERLRIERERGTARTAALVVTRVLDWYRALTLSRDAELEPEARRKLELDALEAEVELDVLTGGWFGQRAARERDREPPPAPPPAPKAPEPAP